MNSKQGVAAETVDDLVRLWESQPSEASLNAEWYLGLGVKALEFGHPSLAYDILNRGLSRYPNHAALTYRAALALARAGSFRSATELVNPLLASLATDDALYQETLSLAGRLAKDCYQKLTDRAARREAAQESAARYQTAFARTQDYFPGINAATMSVLGGDHRSGRKIAEQVLATCLDLAQDADEQDYWLAATLGEAQLLLGRDDEAAQWYEKATRTAGDRAGDIASMRRQVRLLSEVISIDPAVLQALDIPKVVAFAGHMNDRPGAKLTRFPAALEPQVCTGIRAALDRYGAEIGYASAACGADIIFLEEMLARGGQIHIALPFNREDFVKTSVAFAGNDWVERFERVISNATAVTHATTEGYLGDDILFQYTGDLVNEMALLRAEQLAIDPLMLAVLDPDAPVKSGGTADNLSRWRKLGKPAEIIDLARIHREAVNPSDDPADDEPPDSAAAAAESQSARDIRTMLFADVVGFSKLREEAAPSFFVEFLGQIAEVIKLSDPRPAACNTWGDGLFIVFDAVAAAADFALRLRDMVVENDWTRAGLPSDTNIRIAVHAGPVYRAYDPIIERDNYFGAHVNRAARIEPVTTPGSVFVSEQTACLLAAQGSRGFACDYLGVMDFAKQFGSGALYRLRRTDEIE